MAMTPSNMPALGIPAPDFALPDTTGRVVHLEEFANAPALLVAFCPFVKHIREAFVAFANECQERGLAVVAISSNDADNYPDDSPDAMRDAAEEFGFGFAYLYDEAQSVARAYAAACTPDFFLYDADRKLAYRGQFDSSRPGNDQPVDGSDLRAAVDAVLEGETPAGAQVPSIGCNIKWKPGHAPD